MSDAQTPRQRSIEEQVRHLQGLVAVTDPATIADFRARLLVSWIYHDSALEGTVYTIPELQAAIDNQVVSDTSLIPVYDEIRQHKAAVELIRDLAEKKRVAIGAEVVKRIYLTLAPEEAEAKGTPKYRKDMPLHRLYFHEIAPPDKISYHMRQLLEWINSPETRRSMHPVRLASRAHFRFMHIYPFPKHSGKVGRLLMNLMLMRHGYPPAIIHATDRQRYYDALKTSPNATAAVVNDALASSVESAVRFLEDARIHSAIARQQSA